MAQFIPRRDETIEADPHQKWLEKRSLDHESRIAKLRAELDKLLRANATSGKQVAAVNNRASATRGDGLPPGGTTGMTVRKVDSGSTATWTTEWQGLMPEYWVTLDPAGASYYVSAMGLLLGESDDEDLSKSLLPPALFSVDGKTLYPINVDNFGDAVLGPGGQGEFPMHLHVDVYPSYANEQFTIHLPSPTKFYGVTTPIYTFELYNGGSFDANVQIAAAELYYEASTVPVLGVHDPFSNPWQVEPGFLSAWSVRNVRGWGTSVTPVVYYNGGTPDAASSDPWWEQNVLRNRHCFEIAKDGALSVAVIPRRAYNATVTDLTIGQVTASVGTAPSGVDLTMVVKKNGTSISSAFTITAGTNTGVAVLTDTAFAAGDYITVEVTQTGSASDLNTQIWAG